MPRLCRSYKRVRASNGKLVRRCAKYKSRSRHRRSARRHKPTPGCTRFKLVYSSAYGKRVWRCAKRRSVTSHYVTTYVTPPSVVPLLAPAPSGVFSPPSAAAIVADIQSHGLPPVESLPPAISPKVLRRLRDQMRRLRPSSMSVTTMSRWPQNRPRRRP